MARQATVAQILINDALPEDLRDYNRVLDKKALTQLLQQVAQRYPERYREISHKLNQLGGKIAFESGGNSPLVKDLVAPDVVRKFRARVAPVLTQIINDDRLSPEERNQKIVSILAEEAEPLQKAVFQELKEKQNPLARQILAGARGNPLQLNSLVGADLLYADHRNQPIPVPVLSSYSHGLSPVEYFAASYGARKGVIDLKKGTAEAGYLGKQLNQLAHRLMVTAVDREEGESRGVRGLPVDTTDPDNEGALLAHPTGGFAANTVLTPAILKKLNEQGHSRILVRSPVVLSPPEGGVYARDVGVREKGGLPAIGEIVGMAAAQALSEPLTQAQMCLAQGTLVRMADFSVKPIEQIVPGDRVLGADRTGLTFPVQVRRVFDNGLRECIKTRFRAAYQRDRERDAAELISTPDHKVLMFRRVSGSKGEIYNGHPQILPVGTKTGRLAAVRPRGFADTLADMQYESWRVMRPMAYTRMPKDRVEPVGLLPTFDIEVDHPDHLFVLANGLIVSNSSKHSGGVASGGASVSGFDYIDSLFNPAEHIRGGATHAQLDGLVGKIEQAPMGGHYVTVDGREHYVPVGRTLRVKSGDTVEAGDLLSDGVPSAAQLVHHKGIGEGSRLLVKELQSAYRAARITAHRRNLELLTRGLVDHVRLTDDSPEGVPDDIMSYREYERNYQPREGATRLAPASAKGKFLERPVLHYSIGTKIRPSVVQTLQEFGINEVEAHDDPPPFVPEMVRAANILQHDPDWMTRFYGSGLKRSLQDAVHRGLTSRSDSTSFVPALAEGVNFGKQGPFQSPKDPIPVHPPAMPAVQPLNKAFPSLPEIKAADAPPRPTPAEAKVPGKVSDATAATLGSAPAANPPASPKPPAPRKAQGLAALRSYEETNKDWQKNLSRAFFSAPGMNPAPAAPAAPAVRTPAPVTTPAAPAVRTPAPVTTPAAPAAPAADLLSRRYEVKISPELAAERATNAEIAAGRRTKTPPLPVAANDWAQTALSRDHLAATQALEAVTQQQTIPSSRIATPGEIRGMRGVMHGQQQALKDWDQMDSTEQATALRSIQDRQQAVQREVQQRAQANAAFENQGLLGQAYQLAAGQAPERAFDNHPDYQMDPARQAEVGLTLGATGLGQMGLGYRGGLTSAVDLVQNPVLTPLSWAQSQAPQYLTATGARALSKGSPMTAEDRAFYGAMDTAPMVALQGADEAAKRKIFEAAVQKTSPALAKLAPGLARKLTPDRLIRGGNALQGLQAADQALQLAEVGGKARDAAIEADQAQVQAQQNAAKSVSQAQQILARDRANMAPDEVAAMEQSIADRRRVLEQEIAQEQLAKQQWGEKWPWQRASDLIFNPDAVPNEAFAQQGWGMAPFDYVARPAARALQKVTGLTTLGSDSLEASDAKDQALWSQQAARAHLAEPANRAAFEQWQQGRLLTPKQQQAAETYAQVLREYQNEQAQLQQAWSQRPWYGKLYDRTFNPQAVPE